MSFWTVLPSSELQQLPVVQGCSRSVGRCGGRSSRLILPKPAVLLCFPMVEINDQRSPLQAGGDVQQEPSLVPAADGRRLNVAEQAWCR